MIKILIADDHQIFREGIKKVLGKNTDIVVAGESGDGLDVINELRNNDYDVLVLDLNMPGVNGFDILKTAKQEKPRLSILVLSMYPEEKYAVRLLKAGASGYLNKGSIAEELIEAIRVVSRGEKYINRSLGQKLADFIEHSENRPLHESLSDREFQVMCLIGQGKTVTQISRELYLGVSTISTYRSRILEKLKMQNTAELIRYVLQNDLLEQNQTF
jgi:DNA-binding NarL/FixJ family response regulator